MAGQVINGNGHVFDQDTGAWIGVLDNRGNTQLVQSPGSRDGFGGYYRNNPLAFSVMATPPTIITALTSDAAWTSSSLSTGLLHIPINYDGNTASAAISGVAMFKGAYYALAGTTYPDYLYMSQAAVTTGGAGGANPAFQVSFLHTGSKFAFQYKGITGAYLIKVDDQFVSIAPTSIPNNGSLCVAIVDFGTVGTRRIDIITTQSYFGGVWIDASDSIAPAVRRGPRTVVMADSFGEGAGNEVSSLLSYINYAAEYLGWDDVIPSALGATGLVAAPNPKPNYIGRAARDVVALSPDLVLVQLSYNDQSSTAATVLTAAQSLVTVLLGGTKKPTIGFISPSVNGGAYKTQVANGRAQNSAVKAWCAANGYLFVDTLNLPLGAIQNPHATTISSSASQGATSLNVTKPLIIGSHYSFDDGTIVYVKANVSTTATIDGLATAQASGARLTQCGATYLTGTGRVGATTGWGSADVCVSSDAVHPANRGHKVLGRVVADQLLLALNR